MDMRDLLLMASMALHFGQTVWAWMEKRNDKTEEKLKALTEKVTEMDKDLGKLQQGPNHEDLGKIYEAVKKQGEDSRRDVERLSATVNQLVGENRGQTDMLRSIYNRLAEKAL